MDLANQKLAKIGYGTLQKKFETNKKTKDEAEKQNGQAN
jgi:hypothetical protein